MEKWLLSDIARYFGAKLPIDAEIENICTDTRAITPNSLFVALEGERFDGHNFVNEAFKKGAVAAICHKPIEAAEKPVIMVKNTQRALITLGCAYRLRYNIPVVAVTGSVGKTTTKEMIACVLGSCLKTLKTEGNLNNEIGLPLTLLRLDKSYECAVIEMGMTHKDELSVLTAATLPSVAVITNIGVSHIENLGSRENILSAKLEITEGLPAGGSLVLNYDDDLLCDIKDYCGFDIISYSIINQYAKVRALNIHEADDETAFDISYKNNLYPACIPCVGRHNILNALAAFSTAVALKLDLHKGTEALKQYTPAGMRQRVVRKSGITVIEDCYNASPDSMRAALATLQTLKKNGRSIAVLADMLELGDFSQQAHEGVGQMVGESGTDILITYGEKAEYIADAATHAGIEQVYSFEDKHAAGEKLLALAQKDDIILFKGSRGMKLEEMMEQFYAGLADNTNLR